jgi:puromycin-sensitive aminopeptidase
MSNPYRLSPVVTPSAYRLTLAPNLDAATFEGSVEIDVEIHEAVTEFSLNAIELEVSAATVTAGGATLHSSAPVAHETYETLTFSFAEPLPVGPATIALTFTGILNDQLHGFYRSTYTDADGVTHTIATTQFEATDARRAFPCFDEPSFKATYETTLIVPSHLGAYSNTRELQSIDLGNGTKEVHFAPTMKMSTYLVAFVVGPFEASAPVDVAGTPLRIVYPHGKGHLISWAMEVASFALTFFTEYFDIAYPGDKLDLVAIPDFAAGAMENLGCVTFRETELLIDPETATHDELERVALVVNHELAHMWFGDLVTMGWWEGIWLNEAFATFMESLCTDHFRPEWKKWVTFNPSRDMAFTVDGQHSTRPIEYEVISPNDCRGMFDILTYVKGCSVLRMLEQYLGETVFRDGIRLYLKRHAYANTVTADLWSALEAASGQPVGEIMDTWILQGGYPLVSVEGSTLRQEPFAYQATAGDSNIGHAWKVPVLTRPLGGGATSSVLLEAETTQLDGEGLTLVNAGGSGFYRTAYDHATLSAIAADLTVLDELERAVLFSDTWASILVGHASFADLFTLARTLHELDEPATWTVVANALRMANRILDDAGRATLAHLVRQLTVPARERLTLLPIPGESVQAATVRGIVLELLGTLGDDAEVRHAFAAKFDAGEVSGSLADAIVAVTMAQGREGDAEICEERRQRATTPQDEQRYLFAPALSGSREVVLAAVERAFSDVRTQDAPYLLGSLMRNRLAGEAVWREVTARFAHAIDRFPNSAHPALVGGMSTLVSSEALAAEIRNFHEANPVPAGQRQIEQFMDLMDLHVAVASRERATLATSLSQLLN